MRPPTEAGAVTLPRAAAPTDAVEYQVPRPYAGLRA